MNRGPVSPVVAIADREKYGMAGMCFMVVSLSGISPAAAFLPCLNLHALPFGYLDCACVLQQVWQLALLCLQLGVAANVLVVDEDVWYGALVGDLLEGVLDGGTVVCDRR